MSGNSFLLSFEPDERGGFVVRDARSRRHVVPDEASLWRLLAELSHDPALPQVKVEKRNDLVGIVAGLARRVIPKHADLVDAAEPIVHHTTELVPVIQRYRAARGGKR